MKQIYHVDVKKLRDGLEVGDDHANMLLAMAICMLEDSMGEFDGFRALGIRFGLEGIEALKAFKANF